MHQSTRRLLVPGRTITYVKINHSMSITSMTHVAGDWKLCSVLRSSIHHCQGNWMAFGYASYSMPTLLAHFVQKLYVGTVGFHQSGLHMITYKYIVQSALMTTSLDRFLLWRFYPESLPLFFKLTLARQSSRFSAKNLKSALITH